jgi:hypothetical protein
LKKVVFTDKDGLKRLSILRDKDNDPEAGIIQSPPDLSQLDWQVIVKNIHNGLMEHELITLKDVQIRGAEFNKIIMAAVVKPIFGLYQQE